MIIKKLGALLLTAILGLTLVVTPVIYATQDNTVLQGKVCNSTDNCKKTQLEIYFSENPFGPEIRWDSWEIHVKKGPDLSCSIRVQYLNSKGEWKYTHPSMFKILPYLGHIYIYQHGKEISKQWIIMSKEWARRLPELDRGKYAIKFSYHGSQKNHLLPCKKLIALYVE